MSHDLARAKRYVPMILAAPTLAVMFLTISSPADAERLHVVALDEQNCRESAVTRMPVRTEQLRALVPPRYGLLPGSVPDSSRTLLNTYTCESISVDGAPVVPGPGGPTVVSIWSAIISSRDGITTSGSYLLSYATNNPLLFAKLQQSGLPVAFEPASTVEATEGAGAATLTFALRGPVNYDLTAVATEPTGVAASSSATWFYDSAEGPVTLAFHNSAPAPTVSAVTADFTRFEPYASMAVTSPTPVNMPAFYFHGSWTTVAEPAG